ncbi:MAG: DUF177 domain-containing protein [Atopobiaceae bacterium]|nr:DUF177 domain-containing protein [Atopobiaceae bacterium]
MDAIIIALDDHLAEVGETYAVEGTINITTFSLGEREFCLPNGLQYDVVLTNAGEGILATGVVRGHVKATCDRCLDDTEFDVVGEVDEYYLFHEPDPGVLEDDEEEGPDYLLVESDSTINLADSITSAFAMELPYVVLCKEDCAGLCPVCGENLNHVDCGHAEQLEREAEEARLASSPFAALLDLDLEK